MIKAVVFDMDGVLLDSEAVNIQAAVIIFEKEGIKLTDSEKDYVVGRHPVDYIPYFGKRYGIPLTVQKELYDFQHLNYYAIWDKIAKPMPEATNVINRLRSLKKILALATSSSKKTVENFLSRFHFSDTFSLIITKNDVTLRKPDPQIYNIVKEKLNLSEKNILVIEDTRIGVESAKKASLVCAAIPNEYTKNQDFSEADYVLTSLNQILNII